MLPKRKIKLSDILDDNKTSVINHGERLDVTLKSNHQTVSYRLIKKLGKGGYGGVFLFTVISRDKKDVDYDAKHIAVKEDTGNRSEYDVIQAMNRQNKHCNVIPLRQIPSKSMIHIHDEIQFVDVTGIRVGTVLRRTKKFFNVEYFAGRSTVTKQIKKSQALEKEIHFTYIMKVVDATLADYIHKSAIKELVMNLDRIITSLREQMYCLLDVNHDFVYTDLKPENIGLLYDKNGHVSKVYLIDLGSVFKDKDNEYVGTYPCKENTGGFFKLESKQEKHKCLNTCLFVLILHVLQKGIVHDKFIKTALKKTDNYVSKRDFKNLLNNSEVKQTFFTKRIPKLVQNTLILFNILEHQYDKKHLFPSCKKILKTLLK